MRHPFTLIGASLLLLAACDGMPGNGNGAASSSSSLPAIASSSSSLSAEDMITVTSPAANELVTSPLTITGEARGNWYFEASFPVQLFDADGNQIAMVPAMTADDWMTTDFVPFSVTLTFPQPATPTGTLVLSKDNPSGLPEHAASISIPVRFTP